MADISIKEQKLAAARKKLRKFQKQKADTFPKLSRSGQSSPLDSHRETLSSSSSVTDVTDLGSAKNENDHHSISAVVNNSTLEYDLREERNNDFEDTTSFSQVPYTVQNENSNTVSPSSLFISKTSDSHQSTGISEITKGNIINGKGISLSSSSTDLFELPGESPDNEGSVCSETDASMTTVIQRKPDGSSVYHSQGSSLKSTTESLRQLSLQISGLVNDADIHDPNRQELTIIELEKRNNELASFLENEKQKSLKHTSLIEELKRIIESQNIQIQGFQKTSIAESSEREVNGLREQLQVHIQTIGILVAEKSELQTSLSHIRYSLEQKSGEVTDLQGRLGASREHIKAIESTNQELKNQLAKLTENKGSDLQQLTNLQTSNAKLSKLCDEMRATTAELTERLAIRTEENKKVNTELAEVRKEYELAQVHIEQLKNNSTEDFKKQLEEQQDAYSESVRQVSASRASLEHVEKEKQRIEAEYKSYASQLAAELDDSKDKLTKETKKYETFKKTNDELQAELKAKEGEQNLAPLLEALTQEKNKLVQEVSDIQESKKELEDRCSSLCRDNGQLSQYLTEISAKYEALEAAVDRNNTYQVDTSQLLQSMQSDKIAASRALSQNKQLKEQLEELQNGFVMMSNKKLELTEKLEKELHIKKGIFKEIAELGEELSSYKQELLSKQREIEIFKGNKTLSGTETSYENQIEYPINGVVHHEYHHECEYHHHEHDGHDHHEHNRHIVMQSSKEDHRVNDFHQHADDHKKSDLVGMLNHDVELDTGNEDKEGKLKVSRFAVEDDDDYAPLRAAHRALELKFLKCMEKLALVSDEKQELEHLVQQLQLETETVGDYITIYQFQRGVMKQQMQELKLELDLLKTEKQETFNKLSKVQKLIEGLAGSKNFSKEGLMKGVSSIMNTSSTKDNKPNIVGEECEVNEETQENTVTPSITTENNKNETVKQIMELLTEMETATQFDVSTFNRIHPCSHCSGRLITI